MKITHSISGIVILLLLTTCKHTQYDVRGCGEFTTYQDVKDFGMFPVGTYWIYENQLSLERDTFTVSESSLLYFEGEEIGFYTRMTRTQKNSEWLYSHNVNHNILPFDNPCEIRRIWMDRIDFDSQGSENGTEQSELRFPIFEGSSYYSLCGTEGGDVHIERVWQENILEYSSISLVSIVGPAFSLNSCFGENYRYVFGQQVGLISWENLDSLNGKWQLIEFEPQ